MIINYSKIILGLTTCVTLSGCADTRTVVVDRCNPYRDYNCRPVREEYIPLPEREIGPEYRHIHEERIYVGPRRGIYRRYYH